MAYDAQPKRIHSSIHYEQLGPTPSSGAAAAPARHLPRGVGPPTTRLSGIEVQARRVDIRASEYAGRVSWNKSSDGQRLEPARVGAGGHEAPQAHRGPPCIRARRPLASALLALVRARVHGGCAQWLTPGRAPTDDPGMTRSVDDHGMTRWVDDPGMTRWVDDHGMTRWVDDHGMTRWVDDHGMTRSVDDHGKEGPRNVDKEILGRSDAGRHAAGLRHEAPPAYGCSLSLTRAQRAGRLSAISHYPERKGDNGPGKGRLPDARVLMQQDHIIVVSNGVISVALVHKEKGWRHIRLKRRLAIPARRDGKAWCSCSSTGNSPERTSSSGHRPHCASWAATGRCPCSQWRVPMERGSMVSAQGND
ncbi:hypothetical protein CYMTET_35581 [Cymbomonas tetramitiformis]|uniref:Uncharacterized protein n=1 Tax=Cymbomonas tetramitiformis TaxID=36881 RepID=A0AAE0KNS2_9CHLO|nr:hypothetical protein CYMTET_35581 [Cymbomonas tetramitiformis]